MRDDGRRARLELVFPTGQELFEAIRRDPAQPTRFLWKVPEDRDLPPETGMGAMVSATIRVVDREADFHVHLRVVERRTGGDRRGIMFEFLPEEKTREELVVACAEGESIAYHRRRRARVACELPVVLTLAPRGELAGTCTTVSVGGMHVSLGGSFESLAPDAVVEVRIDFEGKRLSVRGRVTSRIEAGPQRGVGIEFLFQSARQRDELAERVGALASPTGHRTDL